ncbi:hypothetical protein [Sediminibacillus halophilus]|uniref:Uncharacterized protein n=1 Tax=Sediminibacillus halophilus TaxID=482461 RepID=A0A1G9X2J0_9BACI|nr:hypothetical protein [Sediminibacillus halophilus]SDM90984.1 hypothetical protein SAMN05216244_3726 [Sediminibacillus halophilus]
MAKRELWPVLSGAISRYIADNEAEISDKEIIDLSILQLLIEMKSDREEWGSEKRSSVSEGLPVDVEKELEAAIETNKRQFIQLIESLQSPVE